MARDFRDVGTVGNAPAPPRNRRCAEGMGATDQEVVVQFEFRQAVGVFSALAACSLGKTLDRRQASSVA